MVGILTCEKNSRNSRPVSSFRKKKILLESKSQPIKSKSELRIEEWKSLTKELVMGIESIHRWAELILNSYMNYVYGTGCECYQPGQNKNNNITKYRDGERGDG